MFLVTQLRSLITNTTVVKIIVGTGGCLKVNSEWTCVENSLRKIKNTT